MAANVIEEPANSISPMDGFLKKWIPIYQITLVPHPRRQISSFSLPYECYISSKDAVLLVQNP
jgi:hypothetical protein